MFAFLNDLSISPVGVIIANNWDIIKQLMKVSTELHSYGIRKIRVPVGLTKFSIAGSHSLAYYAVNTKGDDSRLLLDFMANRLETSTTEIAVAVNKVQKDRVVDFTSGNKSSQLLLEAYLMKGPSLSFQTHSDFSVDLLDCVYHVLLKDYKIYSTPVNIENVFKQESFTTHRAFLVDMKLQIVFSKTKWKPKDQPIWNKHTGNLLKELEFPLSPKGLRDKKEELQEIGTMVAELNAWQFDRSVTNKNRNAGQLRKIFRSKNNANSFYLSIDFENANGRFEFHDNKGTHLGEISFVDGELTKERDNTGNHDIQVN